MTEGQLAAIAAMQLTVEDMGSWMQEQGVSMCPAPGAEGGRGPPGGIIEEERATMRATAQAGGGMRGEGGQFGNMSEEDRESMRATAEASGVAFPGGGRSGAGRGQLAVLAEWVVELLSTIAGE